MYVIDKFKLTNKVAIITGGAGLLGIKHAEAIAEAGGIPILVDIDNAKLKSSSDTLKNLKHEIYPCDVTNKEQLTNLLSWIIEKFGRLDILINNAAINPKVEGNNTLEQSRLENYLMENYQKEVDVGLTSALLAVQIFGTYMAKNNNGVILNIASDLALIAPNQTLYRKEGVADKAQPVKPVTYSIIKHGLIGLTKYVATYWANKGIRCNALAPGGVENGQNEIFLNKIKELIPMNRMAQTDEYKAAVVFLVSEASSYMTGSVITIDGGRTCW